MKSCTWNQWRTLRALLSFSKCLSSCWSLARASSFPLISSLSRVTWLFMVFIFLFISAISSWNTIVEALKWNMKNYKCHDIFVCQISPDVVYMHVSEDILYALRLEQFFSKSAEIQHMYCLKHWCEKYHLTHRFNTVAQKTQNTSVTSWVSDQSINNSLSTRGHSSFLGRDRKGFNVQCFT